MDLKGNGTLKKPPPYGIQMYKGYKNVALTRKTANFVTHHPIAKDFREWLADTLIPDESYYATLARIHQLDPDQQKVQMQDEVMAVWLGNLEFDERNQTSELDYFFDPTQPFVVLIRIPVPSEGILDGISIKFLQRST